MKEVIRTDNMKYDNEHDKMIHDIMLKMASGQSGNNLEWYSCAEAEKALSKIYGESLIDIKDEP
jgi:hypothetical protein